MFFAQSKPLSLPMDFTTLAFTVAIVATGYIYMKAKGKSRKDPMKTAPTPFASLHTQRQVESQMTDLLVELEKMTRQMNAQLDTRAAKLEELLRQADERLAHLDERLAELRSLEGDSLRLPPEGSHGSAVPLDDDDMTAHLVPVPGNAPIPIDPRHAAIYRLADRGLSTHEIARELEQPPGEIDLILALRRRAR